MAGNEALDEPREERAWTVFMLLPRMLLQRAGRGGSVPKSKIQERLTAFIGGHWVESVRAWLPQNNVHEPCGAKEDGKMTLKIGSIWENYPQPARHWRVLRSRQER